MLEFLKTIGWIVCVIYSTIPAFWLLIHPRAERWRSQQGSPYRILVPVWIGTWLLFAAATFRWHSLALYHNNWTWVPASVLLAGGFVVYGMSGRQFSLRQLGGLPELRPGDNEQRLATTGIRALVRHPVYLGHLCEMLAWSLGTGLAVCWALTALAVITGALMIQQEDKELDTRFGKDYREYRKKVPAILPKINRT